MTKRMLVDASHAEETRVVVLDGHRLEEFDLESANRLPLKGNIYLARVVRVEPSLQAAFIEYGGNRHGFLAFGEIHPDYYQIPVADRQRLLEAQAAEAREADEAEEAAAQRASQRRSRPSAPAVANGRGARAGEGEQPRIGASAVEAGPIDRPGTDAAGDAFAAPGGDAPAEPGEGVADTGGDAGDDGVAEPTTAAAALTAESATEPTAEPATDADRAPASDGDGIQGYTAAGGAMPPEADAVAPDGAATDPALSTVAAEASDLDDGMSVMPDEAGGAGTNGHARAWQADAGEGEDDPDRAPAAPPPETLGGEGPDDTLDDAPEEGDVVRERRQSSRYLRNYKIQEVIRRRQVMLVQVVKEERGNKGAALTTFISLAGRFSVLMPNSPRGGGVSRKITSVSDRKRLREAIEEVGLPDGMALIVRTAGAQRPKPEIKRDCEYLLRLWDSIRERTLASTAPALIYEEADLIKRSIRDVFSRDVDEVLIEGDDAFQAAHEFMRMLMPQNARKIVAYRDGGVPLFARYSVEAQLDAMHSPIVQLKSGGYIVINQTEALVAIDVNSGRSTRERHIEDTAFKTNCEAAEEIARQLRLRDLAGLIVIDFIDMESSRNDAFVERRLKDALRHDKARIQVGRISHFGLLEMSRQRLRPSLAETSFVPCPHCQGLGQVRSKENAALTVLRAIEEEGAKRRAAEITVHVAPAVALYLLNRKRQRLADIEDRFGMAVLFEPDESLLGAALRIERLRAAEPLRAPVDAAPAALRMDYAPEPEFDEPDEAPAPAAAAPVANGAAPPAATVEEGDAAKRKRRRRRRRGGKPNADGTITPAEAGAADDGDDGDEAEDSGEDGRDVGAEEGDGAARFSAESGRQAEADPDPEERRSSGAEGAEGSRGSSRRGRGRGRGPRPDAAPAIADAMPAPPPPSAGRYQGPTPANPFAGQPDDIFAALEAAEAAAEAAASARSSRPGPVASAADDDGGPSAAMHDRLVPGTTVPEGASAESLAPAGAAAEVAEPPAAAEMPDAAADGSEPPVVPDMAVAHGAGALAATLPAEAAGPGDATAPPLEGATNGGTAAPVAPLAAAPVQPRLVEAVLAETPKRRGWWAR